MALMATMSSEAAAKKLALRTMTVMQALTIAMQFHRPSGTGEEGSPAMGPLPVIIALALPSFFGTFFL